MNHPSWHPADDPRGDAAVARVNAIRAARGLPPIVERDPAAVRRDLTSDRDAMMVAVAVLHRPGCGATVPDAIDIALVGKPPAMAYDVPPGVAHAILWRTPDRHTPAVFDALDAELMRFTARVDAQPGAVAELAHLAVDRIACAVRRAIADSIAAEDGVDAPIADFAAGVAIDAIVERLRGELMALVGLP